MATFSVVMPGLTRCQNQLFSRCLFRAKHVKGTVSLGHRILKDNQAMCCITAYSFPFLHNQCRPYYVTGSSPSFSRGSPGVIKKTVSLTQSIFPRESAVNFSSASEEKNSKDNKSDSNQGTTTEGTGSEEKPKKESWWRGKNSWKISLVFLGGAFVTWGIALVTSWGTPLLDPDGNEIQDEYTDSPVLIAYLKRTWKEMNIFKKKIQDPSRELLLPDPLKYPYIQPPYTLVIELTGVLIHPDWTYSTGWRFKKRPGIDYFLSNVGPPLFEVVIYSKESGMTADPLVNHLDPQGYVMYRLYRDATRYKDGVHLKDLSCLNRDMSRIIMLDCNKDSVSLQPRNALVLNKWEGKDEDRTLIDLAHFLKTIASSGVDDIRPVLDYYHQFDDPLDAFKDNQRKLQDEEAARAKTAAEETKKKSWLSGFRK